MPDNRSLDQSLRKTITSSKLPELIDEYGELAIDLLTASDTLREIPVFSTISSLSSTFNSIRDYRFTKKLALFLHSLGELPIGERNTLADRLDSEQPFAEKTGEILFDLIEQMEGNLRPLVLAEAFKLYSKKLIDKSDLSRLSRAINLFSFSDIEHLRKVCNRLITDYEKDDPAAHAEVNAGLAYPVKVYRGSILEATRTGQLLLQAYDAQTTRWQI